ncbi:hypothetical protein [Rugosimonospora africana]|uniref:hypothetical protein n=1 Tax=Rugosimonospora africana TaxID=556532 RepID=UPI001EF2FC54|nr:hypothetical protein [Rugosimonospora africana]
MIDELIRKAAVDDEDAIDELSAIADNEPDRLIPHHGLLLDLDVLWPPKLYRSADANTVGRVIEQIDGGRTPKRLDHLLLLLAYSAHPLAESAMRRWATQPPAGCTPIR